MQLARNRSKPEGYVERHHEIPKCIGGTDDPFNLVTLTAREHFLAHVLLAKIYPDTPLVHAAFRMASNYSENRGRGIVKSPSRIYEMLRMLHAQRVGPISSAANKQKSECPWCGKIGGIAIMKRWHFDYCKKNPQALEMKPYKKQCPTPEAREKMKLTRAKTLAEKGWPLKGKKERAEVTASRKAKNEALRAAGYVYVSRQGWTKPTG